MTDNRLTIYCLIYVSREVCMSIERRGKILNKKCGMSKRDAVNDPPFFAFDRDSATDILQSAGSDVTTKKSAMEVNMPFWRMLTLSGKEHWCWHARMHAQGKDFLHRSKPENGVAKAPPGVTQRLFELIPSANHSASSMPLMLRAP